MESLASRLIQVLRAGTVDDAAIEAGAAEDPAAFAEALTLYLPLTAESRADRIVLIRADARTD